MTTPVRRINVAVIPEEIAAITLLIERENISLTEAVRRLIGYGSVLYQKAVIEGAVITASQAGKTEEIRVL